MSGNIILTSNFNLYIYVGQSVANNSQTGGWNGGGAGSGTDTGGIQIGFGGGGSTDLRIVNGEWNLFSSQKSRIIVAAGGGGGGGDGVGGEGGTINGIEGFDRTSHYEGGINTYSATGGTQTDGGNSKNQKEWININGSSITVANSGVNKGGFGYGGTNIAFTSYGFRHGGAGGGGGYYGGGAATRGHGGGGGGSSFISGHTGCNAISSSSTENNIVHTGQPNHYSGKVFTNTVMKAGNESMPSPNGGTETGHSGNGYAKITWHPSL